MTICIFPGTFNPIHKAHIKMAEFALEKYKFEKVIFIPSYIPPHKNLDKDLAQHRLNMVKLALKDNPRFEVSDIEYRSEGKSYSLITVKKLIEKYKLENRINFIIGTDAFVNLDNWYKADELKRLVHFIVFPRKGSMDKEFLDKFKLNGWNFEITSMGYVDISSTGIRNHTEKSSLNKNVEDYIKGYGLYKN